MRVGGCAGVFVCIGGGGGHMYRQGSESNSWPLLAPYKNTNTWVHDVIPPATPP